MTVADNYGKWSSWWWLYKKEENEEEFMRAPSVSFRGDCKCEVEAIRCPMLRWKTKKFSLQIIGGKCDSFYTIEILDANCDGKISPNEIKFSRYHDNKKELVGKDLERIKPCVKKEYGIDLEKLYNKKVDFVTNALSIFVRHQQNSSDSLNCFFGEKFDEPRLKRILDAAVKIGVDRGKAKERLLSEFMRKLFDMSYYEEKKGDYARLKKIIIKAFGLDSSKFKELLKKAHHAHPKY